MSSDKSYTRREFGCIAAACIAGNALPDTFVMKHNVGAKDTFPVNPSVVSTAQDIIISGAIGKVYLGCSSRGCDRHDYCNEDISVLHAEQLLLLCEIMQPGQETTIKSIAVPSVLATGERLRTMMTTLAFSSGKRIEVTSTTGFIIRTGCVIRGDIGSIHIHKDKLQLFSLEKHIQKEISLTSGYSCGTSTEYTALVRQIMYDAHQSISV